LTQNVRQFYLRIKLQTRTTEYQNIHDEVDFCAVSEGYRTNSFHIRFTTQEQKYQVQNYIRFGDHSMPLYRISVCFLYGFSSPVHILNVYFAT
jgi:hypothetical protein